ncbi:hypothetical protein Tco_1121150 [Tanacetum coccineum]|uniref:Uncharacterized protein n=1 Tax=Tanacetum coccineum TaxID=301880 RepID=A0ABQ5IYB5_9ASTR
MLRALGVVVPQARAIEKKWRKMEFGTRFGMAPEFSGVSYLCRVVLDCKLPDINKIHGQSVCRVSIATEVALENSR